MTFKIKIYKSIIIIKKTMTFLKHFRTKKKKKKNKKKIKKLLVFKYRDLKKFFFFLQIKKAFKNNKLVH